jgi:hypothetical protein
MAACQPNSVKRSQPVFQAHAPSLSPSRMLMPLFQTKQLLPIRGGYA